MATVTSRDFYAQRALAQIPRLLTLQDRNPYSPTFGCFHRDYWLYKTSDFPDAVRQFGVHALAQVYKHDFPDNPYRGNANIRDWAIAGLDYWTRLQHGDGSFDEFYPYERGWVGPSAFTTFTAIESYHLLKDEIAPEIRERVLKTIHKAARFIAAGESEEDHLANHHAMACLAVWKAYELTGDSDLERRFKQLWRGFLSYHNAIEGWSREYDGVDPGYLSATVSFLGKIYQTHPDPDILRVLKQSVEFCSYFVYPNGFYGGSMGSRNTQHFYPHGFEILANEIPLAGAIAEKMLVALGAGKLVPPEIMSDRYVFYRVPELLQAYTDYTPRAAELPALPYERDETFTRYFAESRIYVANNAQRYTIANLAKGGVVKVFNRKTGELLLNDCGIIGRLTDGQVVTSQWIDPAYACSANEAGFTVSGSLQVVPSNKLFTPIKSIVFRSALVALGWLPAFSHLLKGNIRKMLMLGQRPVPAQFQRQMRFVGEDVHISDTVRLLGGSGDKDTAQFAALSVGGEFFVRYVPQSRFAQAQELDLYPYDLAAKDVSRLNAERHLTLTHGLDGKMDAAAANGHVSSSKSSELPIGVYDVDYYYGRHSNPQLVYRLKRRSEEVEGALRKHGDGRLNVILDVGTADGLMLDKLRTAFGERTFIGMDYSYDLLGVVAIPGVSKTQGDAEALPFTDSSADAIIATAVIEHVPHPALMLREAARVLRPGGLLIVTTPQPTMEKIASAIGLLKESGHQETFTLPELAVLFQENGFAVLEQKKFMFSPVGFPAEKQIERVFGPLGLQLVMANQLIVGRNAKQDA